MAMRLGTVMCPGMANTPLNTCAGPSFQACASEGPQPNEVTAPCVPAFLRSRVPAFPGALLAAGRGARVEGDQHGETELRQLERVHVLERPVSHKPWQRLGKTPDAEHTAWPGTGRWMRKSIRTHGGGSTSLQRNQTCATHALTVRAEEVHHMEKIERAATTPQEVGGAPAKAR